MAIAAVAALSAISFIAQTEAGARQKKAARAQGRAAEDVAAQEAERRLKETEKFEGRQRSAFLSSGVSLEGSPLLVLEETRRTGKEQALSIREAGRQRSAAIRSGSTAAFQQSLFQGAGTLTSGFAEVNRLSAQRQA